MRRGLLLLSLTLLLFACEKQPHYVTPVLPPEEELETPETPGSPAEEYDFSVVESPLETSMILTKGYMLRYYSVMQSFALNGDGTLYGIQVGTSTNKYLLNVTHRGLNTESGRKYMQFPFAGHGSNMCVEHVNGTDYIWIGSYGSWNGSKYTNSQTIARIPFTAGSKLTPDQYTDHYYLPGLRNVAPAIDFDADLMLIWGLSNTESSTGYFKLFKLSEARALPVTKVKLDRAVTWGGQDSGYPETTQTPEISARNLAALTPVASIKLNGGVLGNGANQGFEIHGNRILHMSGTGNDSTPGSPSTATLTVLDFRGNILGSYQVGAVSSLADLNAFGITDTGFMEAEGVKIYDDVLYLGFATKHSADDKRMVTIFKYDIKK